ncbi:hypothetical protein C2E25_10040 [Geothermobacter hydrogeniphilus]|uniref:Uncharacterized protein n=1 Tax=Geothermobacter hydrogeniphilus TaxID=1969733 RepID=A0A2K2H9E2_9BACT|nr:hypothetical protein C2E25_10040 [Geothermobacter hydrogeniphilus]
MSPMVVLPAVERTLDGFPADVMFQLTNQGVKDLRSQVVTSSQWGGRRTLGFQVEETFAGYS